MTKYDEIVENLLSGGVLQYEETYIAFSRILLSKINGEKICLVYDNERKLLIAKRYLSGLNLELGENIFIEDINNPLSEINKYRTLFNFCHDKHLLVISLIADFKGCWWNRRYPRKIEYWMNYKDYSICKETIAQMVYFSPIYFRDRGQEIYEYWTENKDGFGLLYETLEDNVSKETLKEILEVAAHNKVWSLPQGNQIAKYWECYRHLDDECWVNCGSATGDTIVKYIFSGYEFDKLYAYEGDAAIFKNLTDIVSRMPKEIVLKIELYNKFIGVNEDADNFNNCFKDKRVTLINMDIEGAEMSVLRGATEIIKKQRPVLAICAYHKASDLLEIPKLVQSVANNYVFYLRKYIGYEPGALNEYLYYCVPKERQLYNQ